jgi:branched-chain amino acid transport system permease protein
MYFFTLAARIEERPLLRSLVGATLIAALLSGVSFAAEPLVGSSVIVNFLINVVAVTGLAIYTGNSGIVSWGHSAFLAVGAYASGVLMMPILLKTSALPNLPHWLAHRAFSYATAFVIALILVTVVATVFGIPLSRLPANAAAIATFGVLVIVNVVLIGADNFTRGAQTFYGVSLNTTVAGALVAAVCAIFIARVFRESRLGLQLRASREDDIAAAAVGVNIRRARGTAWILSAIVAGAAGILYAHFLGAFSPKDFYLGQTFILVAMLIVGGGSTVIGAVSGTAAITAVVEIVRRLENGFSIGFISVPQIFGATNIAISLALLAALYFRRGGLFRHELDEILWRRVARRVPASQEREMKLVGGSLDREAEAPQPLLDSDTTRIVR